MTGRCTRMVLQQQQRQHHGILHHPCRTHRCPNVAPIIGRYFVTSSSPSRPRRRRPKALTTSSINNNSATKPITTRDRIRQVIERNQVPSKVADPGKTVNKMLSVAAQRLTWLQTRVYQHWNPDYQPATTATAIAAGGTNTDGTATTTTTTPPVTTTTVRRRTQVVMDRRWWFWNIAFALLPAAVITLYCELRVRPAMEAYNARQNELNQRRDGSKQNASTNSMKLHNIIEESVHEQQTKTFTERLAGLWTEVQALVVDNITGEKENNHGSLENEDVKNESPKETSSQGAASTNGPTTTVQGSSAGGSAKSSSSTTDTTSIEPVNLETLAQRLDRLERLIENNAVGGEQPPNDAIVDEEPPPNKRQSGIRDRIERRIRESALREASSRDEEKDEKYSLDNLGWYMWRSMASLLNNGSEAKDTEPNRDDAVEQKKLAPRQNNDQRTENKENDSKPSSNCKGENHGTDNAPSLADDNMDGKPEKPWWKIW